MTFIQHSTVSCSQNNQTTITEQSDKKNKYNNPNQKRALGASLVAQWLRIRLPMQGTWVRAPFREDPTCHGATKPVHHSY